MIRQKLITDIVNVSETYVHNEFEEIVHVMQIDL